MSLSPLYADRINDLHVNTTADLHQPFDWLRLVHVKITTFRVYARRLCQGVLTRNYLQTSLDFLAFAASMSLILNDSQSSITPQSVFRDGRQEVTQSALVTSPLTLMHNGFTSFKQSLETYFSSFARATPFSIGQKPIFSLGRSIPPIFILHSQAVLLN